MASKEDIIKAIIIALLSAIITVTVTGFLNYPTNVNEKIILVEKKANAYTDKEILNHEKVQQIEYEKILNDINSIKETSSNTNEMVNRLLDIQLNNSKQ